MNHIPNISTATREKINEFARLMDLEFDRTEIAVSGKELWLRIREDQDKFGVCYGCRKESGQEHTFEECVARIHGRIDQLYRPRTAKADLPKEGSMFILSNFKPSPSMVLRPLVMIRLVSDKDLMESQSASNMYALHNPNVGLPCTSCTTFSKLNDLAKVLDHEIKMHKEAIIECHNCKTIHVLTTKGQPDGWVALTRPL
jgi:hypothetical protein